MAEELKVWEKRPGERRIEHPDFPDVQETTFAKGIITNFQLVSTDPIRVKSMVEVIIDGQVSNDYIPIYYKPKERYWDYPDDGAQDYDPGITAYKQAWQSFRHGDEVVVLLKNGKPKMVLGFYDNYPRLGEASFRVGNNIYVMFRNRDEGATKYDELIGYQNLPPKDELMRYLVVPAEKVATINRGYYQRHIVYREVYDPWWCGEAIVEYQEVGSRIHHYYKFTAGPFMYLLAKYHIDTGGTPDQTVITHLYTDNCEHLNTETYFYPGSPGYVFYSLGLLYALYDKDKYQNIRIEFDSFGEEYFPDFKWVPLHENIYEWEDPGEPFYMPHTKEELIATGLWPPDNNVE